MLSWRPAFGASKASRALTPAPLPQIQRLECANSLAANTGRRASASVQQQGRVSIAGCAASECGSWTCTPFAAEQLPIQAALGSVTITCEELQPRGTADQRVVRADSCSAIYTLGAPPSLSGADAPPAGDTVDHGAPQQPHSAGSVDSGRREAEPGGEGRPWQAATDAADARQKF